MNAKTISSRLYRHEVLDYRSARELMGQLSEGQYRPAEVASILTTFKMRPIQLEELRGFQDELLERAIPFHPCREQCIDLCGTGGDGKDSFNISTLAAFVVAAAGYPVVKHGNYGVSSLCGSSNVLEQLGARFTNDPGQLNRQLEEANICFLHAPLFHPAMKAVAPIRREMKTRTFFNMLGPLVNPARPTHQLTGVFSLSLARMYHELQTGNGRRYTVIYSLDGYDELSLTGPAKIYQNQREWAVYPSSLGLEELQAQELRGGESLAEAASIFMDTLSGKEDGPRSRVVAANAALGLQTFTGAPFSDCYEEALEALRSGKALAHFQLFIQLNQTP